MTRAPSETPPEAPAPESSTAGTPPCDEFTWIARLRPLTRGDPSALNLMDDAAVLPARPGFDLVLSKDAVVEGVHFLCGESPGGVARRLLRTALSDLAAKAADPCAYLLLTAWPPDHDSAWRDAFAAALAAEGEEFAVALIGGDTVATTGPLVCSATVLGWAPAGRAVLRSGAKAGHALVACGPVGDGWLGLRAARGEIVDPTGRLAAHYRAPRPLFALRDALRAHAAACADVSDGFLADALNIAAASGLGVEIDLEHLPLSAEARAWRDSQPDAAQAQLALASGGDDYGLVCAVDEAAADAFLADVRATGVPTERVGTFTAGAGLRVTWEGAPLAVDSLGWRH